MTVINAMSFGESGAAIADEQSSTPKRKYNVSQKIQPLGDKAFFGGSGPADFIREIYDESNSQIKGSLPIKEMARIVKDTLFEAKNQRKDDALRAMYDLSLEEIKTGVSRKSGMQLADLTNPVNMLQQLEEQLSLGILIGGLSGNGFEVYLLSPQTGTTKISRPYASIGSGSDESDKVLSSYAASLTRDNRLCIGSEEGLVKLIEATNAASDINVGVGGIPSIRYISQKKVYAPNEENCILSGELVKGYIRDLLPRDFVYSSVMNLVKGEAEFEKVEEDMKTKSKDWKKLDRILRGYKE